MKHIQNEPKNPSESCQKSDGQIKGLILILRGMLREKLATVDNNTLVYFEFHTAFKKLSTVDTIDPDFATLFDVYHCLYAAAFGHPEHRTPCNCIREIIQAMRPYAILPQDDEFTAVGRIAWKVDPCANHAKGGWFVDETTGKRRFRVPPHPQVDDICPKCGGYLQGGAQ